MNWGIRLLAIKWQLVETRATRTLEQNVKTNVPKYVGHYKYLYKNILFLVI